MDDSEVVKVLAEFMGLKKCRCSGYCISWVDESGKVYANPETYLTDYNAIAEVWRRVDEGPYSYIYMRVRGVLDDDEHWRSWYQSKPRAHAHALAKAILEAK